MKSSPRIDKDLAVEALEKSADGIVVIDGAGNIVYANPAMRRVFGYPEGAIRTVDEGIRAVFPDPETQSRLATQWSANVAAGKPFEEVTPVTLSNGEKRWFSFRATPLANRHMLINHSDVTDLKMLEDRYRGIFERAAESILLFNAQTGAFVEFNDAAHARLGYTREEFKLIRMSDIAPRGSKGEIKRHIKEILANGSHVLETMVSTKTGELRDVRVSCKVISIGRQKLIQCIMHDVTESKRAESALRESEAKFRNLADQSPNMIFINRGGKLVYVNMKCQEILGYSKKEYYAPDFNFLDLIAPEYHALTLRNLEAHLKKGKDIPPYEYILVKKNGEKLPAMISTKLISFGGKRAILGISTDISKLKSAETEMLAQKQTLEQKNTALKEILAQIEEEKLQIRRQIAANAQKLLIPLVKRLKSKAGSLDKRYLDLLESNLQDLCSRFGAELGAGIAALSPRETEIANMIKGGLSSKDIADMLRLSLRTVHTHRERIRRKFGISNKEVNLFGHLQSLK